MMGKQQMNRKSVTFKPFEGCNRQKIFHNTILFESIMIYTNRFLLFCYTHPANTVHNLSISFDFFLSLIDFYMYVYNIDCLKA